MKISFTAQKKKGDIPTSLWRFVAGYPWLILSLLGLTLASGLLTLLFPLVIAQALDDFSLQEGRFIISSVPFKELLAVIFGIMIFSTAGTFLSAWISERLAFDLRSHLAFRLVNQSANFVDKQSPARLLTRFTSDVDATKKVISGGIVSLFSALFMLMGSLFMLFRLSSSLTWLIASCVPFLIAVFSFVVFRLRTLFRLNQENLEKVNSHVAQSVTAASLIRVLNASARQVQDFRQLNERTWSLAVTIVRNFATLIPLVSLIMNTMVLITFWFGGKLVMDGSLSLGQLSAFFNYTSLLLFPIFVLAGATGILTQSFVSFKRVSQVLNEPFTKREGTYQGILKGHYILKDVCLTLGEGEDTRDALSHISCILPERSHIAIVGPIGAGKTQLLNILTSLTEPTSGAIILDGVPLGDWELGSLTSQIGMVFQDSLLFSGTLKENLRKENLGENDLKRALETAQLLDFIASLPQGLDTVLAERGQDLSGGQRQRLMLARALVHNPRLLFLDDFTARLDMRTERAIKEALKKNYPDLMTIQVSQNIQIAQEADWVLLMMEGELLAQGTHKDLSQSSWEYAQLLNSGQALEPSFSSLTREGEV